MKSSVLFLALIGVILTIGATVLSMFCSASRGTLMQLYVLTTCNTGNLLAIWSTMGSKPTCWRFVGAVAGLTACAWVDNSLGPGLRIEAYVIPVMIQMTVTALLLSIAAMAGITLEDSTRPSLPGLAVVLGRLDAARVQENRDLVSRRPQWSLFRMLSWTTAVAVLLSSVSVLSPFLPPDIVAYLLYWLVVLLLGVFAIASPVILWAVVGTRHLLARVVLLGIFIMVSLAAIGPTSTLVTVVWLAAFAGALRLAGYQLLWRRRIVL